MARFERLEFDQEPEGGPGGAAPLENAEESEEGHARWMQKADDHRRRGLYENSLRFYSRALELDKTITAAWVGQIQMLVLLGEFTEAELWAKVARDVQGPRRPDGGPRPGPGSHGRPVDAMELADAALREEGSSAYRWMVRGELLISNKDGVDRHCFDKAVVAENDWLVPLEIALIYLHHENPSNALVRARQSVEKAPQAFYAWLIQGQCEAALGFVKGAKSSFARCLELSPRHLEASRQLAGLDARGWSLSSGLRRLIGRGEPSF